MATCCTEYVLLEPKCFAEPAPTQKRRRKSRKKKTPKRTKIDWPKIAPGFLRLFVINEVTGVPVYHDIEKASELVELQKAANCQTIETMVLGPILNKKQESSGRELLLFFDEEGLHTNKKVNPFFAHQDPAIELLGTILLASQSASTGNLVNVKHSDLKHLPDVLTRDKQQRADFLVEMQAAGAVLIQPEI